MGGSLLFATGLDVIRTAPLPGIRKGNNWLRAKWGDPLHRPSRQVQGVGGEILGQDVPLPGRLAKHAELSLLSHNLPAEFARLRAFLLA